MNTSHVPLRDRMNSLTARTSGSDIDSWPANTSEQGSEFASFAAMRRVTWEGRGVETVRKNTGRFTRATNCLIGLFVATVVSAELKQVQIWSGASQVIGRVV